MINFDVYGHCGLVLTYIIHCECFRSNMGISMKTRLVLTYIIHCECFRSNMGISMKTRVVQNRVVSIPMSPKCVDLTVPVPKWLKTLQTQYQSVRRQFGTDAEVFGDTSGPKRWYRNGLIQKCLDTEVSGNRWNLNLGQVQSIIEVFRQTENETLHWPSMHTIFISVHKVIAMIESQYFRAG